MLCVTTQNEVGIGSTESVYSMGKEWETELNWERNLASPKSERESNYGLIWQKVGTDKDVFNADRRQLALLVDIDVEENVENVVSMIIREGDPIGSKPVIFRASLGRF
jgi:hypothetical protein